MTTKSKAIGTKTETMATRYLRDHGFPYAERRVLAGTYDLGDILLQREPCIIAQVKGGAAAEQASDAKLVQWCEDTEQQRLNANAEHAFLIVKRAGHGLTKIGGWWVVTNNMGLLCRFRLDEYVRYLNLLVGGDHADQASRGEAHSPGDADTHEVPGEGAC